METTESSGSATPEEPQPSAQPAAETETPNDPAEKPGSSSATHDHEDALADEWGEESFPGSDPPAHY